MPRTRFEFIGGNYMFNVLNFYNNDPMGTVLFTYPLIVFLLALVMQLILKKKVGILLINFVFWLVLTFTVFNSSFLIYCFVYTFVALLGTLMGELIILVKNKFISRKKV